MKQVFYHMRIVVPSLQKIRLSDRKKEKCRWYEEKYDFEPFLQEALENVETVIINPSTKFDDDEDLF